MFLWSKEIIEKIKERRSGLSLRTYRTCHIKLKQILKINLENSGKYTEFNTIHL